MNFYPAEVVTPPLALVSCQYTQCECQMSRSAQDVVNATQVQHLTEFSIGAGLHSLPEGVAAAASNYMFTTPVLKYDQVRRAQYRWYMHAPLVRHILVSSPSSAATPLQLHALTPCM